MASLSVHEARTRAASIAVTSYDVGLDLTIGDRQFRSITEIEFDSLDRQDTFLDVKPAELVRVRLNERHLDVAELHDGRLHLRDLDDHNVVSVEAIMAYSSDGEGLHRAVDPEDGRAYTYAMTFLDAAPRVFGCFDQPDLKAPYQISVTTPTDWIVIGNGHATQIQPGHWQLATTKPLSTYFVTLVAGPYHSITTEHDGIPLGLHCRQSLAEHLDKDADELFTVTKQCFDEYHRLFEIRYPFGDYHQAFVPEFNAGAMENPGCVTFRDELVFKAQATRALRATRANVVAHEMAHQWFGDLVTMRWWDDLWLNESFADYMAHRVTFAVTDFTENWLEFAFTGKAVGIAADQRASTHPVAGSDAPDAASALTNFDGISYSKGAAALRQLDSYLGDAAFIGGVAAYLRGHSYANATLADLVAAWQAASQRDLSAWTHAWLGTSGIDTLRCVGDPAGKLVIERHNGSTEDVSRAHAITVSRYDAAGAATAADLVVERPTTPVPLASPAGSGLVLPDSGDESWAKIRLDQTSVERAGELLRVIPDPMARAVIWGALREGLSDAVVGPDLYVDTVVTALPEESVDLVVERVLGTGGPIGATSYVGTYLHSPDHRRRLADLARILVDRAEAGSNRQLIASRAQINLTHDTALLRSWLDGGAPAGLVVDSDLRWRLLEALCAAGVLGRAEVEAEQTRDPSSQGALAALRCRARIPDSDLKAQVWHDITGDGALSNLALYALAGSFFSPTQRELTDPYVARYFTDLPKTAALRTGWVVERSCHLAYPRFAVRQETVDLATATLDRDDLEPGVRRVISDGTDDLRRVLASRRRYAG